MIKMKKLLPLAFLSSAVCASEPFNLGEFANGKLKFGSANTVFVAGNEKKAALQKISLTDNQVTQLQLPENPIMYSTGYLVAEQSPQAFVLTEQGIYHVTDKAQNLIITASSVFTQNSVEQFESFSFTLDVNNDGLTDFYLPGIESQSLYIQQKDGRFLLTSLPLKAETTAKFNNGHLTISNRLPKMPILLDLNNDSIRDLVFFDKTAITFFSVTIDGVSSSVKRFTSFDVLHNESKQQLTKFEDLNGDGFADIYTKESLADNAQGEVDFDTKFIHRIYFAKPANNEQLFTTNPDIKLTLEGASAISNISDFNGDGVADLALTSIDIGFTDILSMASAAMNNEEFELDTEVAIYKGTGSNQFAKKASASKDFDIAIKLNESNSESGKGVFLKDFNGDGQTDLMVKTDNDELSIYLGDKKRVLSRKAVYIERPLPKSIQNIYSTDFNQDGKEDIVLKMKDKQGNYRIEVQEVKSAKL